MNRDLNPAYSFEEIMDLIDRLESVKEFKRIGSVICLDLDHYTAREFLTIKEKYLKAEKPIWNKEFDVQVKKAKEFTARNKARNFNK